MNPTQILSQFLQNSPQVANNPQFRNYIEVLQSGDAQRGQQIAQNLCQSYGVDYNDAARQAKQFFMSNFKGG